MKNILSLITLICVFSLIFDSDSLAAQDVTFTLTNPHTVTENGDDFYIADVLTYSNSGFKLGSGLLYFNYDTTVLGANVFVNNNLEIIIPDSSILDKKIGVLPFEFDFYGDFIVNDNSYSRFSYSWQHDFSYACLDTNNIDYYSDLLFSVKLKFKNGQSMNDPSLCLESGDNYANQTYTACGPENCNTNDCFNNPGTQLTTDAYPCNDCKIVYATSDSGMGSLREAINCAAIGDTIRFAKSLKLDSIILSSTFLTLDKDIYIIAKKDFKIFVHGTSIDRIFDVLVGNSVLIEGLKMSHGTATQGSAIRNEGNLTIKDISIHFTPSDTIFSQIYNLSSLTIIGENKLIKE